MCQASGRIIDKLLNRWIDGRLICCYLAMSYVDSRPGRRRRGGPRLTDSTLNVALGADLRRRIDGAADRYGCAAGMVARYAIEHGMRGALQRLRRELPPERQSDGNEGVGK